MGILSRINKMDFLSPILPACNGIIPFTLILLRLQAMPQTIEITDCTIRMGRMKHMEALQKHSRTTDHEPTRGLALSRISSRECLRKKMYLWKR
jgi:hypothetical protein